MEYTKPPLDIQSILNRLEKKGLVINDPNEAEKIISFIGYFRFRGYALHFTQSAPANFQHGTRIFNSGTNLDDVISIYEFDRALRGIVMAQLERIEVAVRAVIDQELNFQFGSHWYMDSNLWSDRNEYTKWFSAVSHDIHSSKEKFILHYFSTYRNPTLPPSWAIAECLSFGKWSTLYRFLNQNKHKIAGKFGLNADVMGSWLHSLSVLRNICAHHARLWDKSLPFSIKKHPQYKNHFKHSNRFYAFSASIRILTKKIDNNDSFKKDLIELFNRYQNITPYMLYFPTHWDSDPLWV